MIALELSLDLWLEERLPELRDRVVEEHRYLCIRAARKFLRNGLDRGDLEQVAAIGLIKAVDRFSRDCGVPFDGYAWRLIIGELMHFVRDCERLVRAPRRIRELERKWHAAENDFLGRHGREARPLEIAKALGASPHDASEVQAYRSSAHLASVETLHGCEDLSLAYTLDAQLDRLVLDTALQQLSQIERRIVDEIYQRGTPVQQLADSLGYSRRHVSRLHRSALKKLQSGSLSRETNNRAL